MGDNSKGYYFIVLLFLLFGFLILEVRVQNKMLALRKTDPISNLTEKTKNIEVRTNWIDSFQKSTVNIDTLDEYDYDDLSKTLSAKTDFKFLQNLLFDPNTSIKMKGFIVEIIARSNQIEGLEILKNYSLQNEDSNNDQVLITKAQAVEGISLHSNKSLALEILNEISKDSNSQFIQERADRSKENLIDQTQIVK
jgi:uncharacterized protein (UPF0147 family)